MATYTETTANTDEAMVEIKTVPATKAQRL